MSGQAPAAQALLSSPNPKGISNQVHGVLIVEAKWTVYLRLPEL